MPTSAEFDPGYPDVPFTSPGDYAIAGSVNDKGDADPANDEFNWTGASTEIDGTFAVTNGYRLEYASGKYAFFPAPGYRYFSHGALSALGVYGYAWSSSPSGVNGYNLRFNAPGVNPSVTSSRSFGFPVRCVKK
jgi:hypothetical protein